MGDVHSNQKFISDLTRSHIIWMVKVKSVYLEVEKREIKKKKLSTE